MREKINQLGGDLNDRNIYCHRCVELRTGGFDPEYGIQICANSIRSRGDMEDTLAHGNGGRLLSDREPSEG